MSELSRFLAEINEKQKILVEQQTAAISNARRTFEHLPARPAYRYYVVRADGREFPGGYYMQRPAAKRTLHQKAKEYAGNSYLYDSRERKIFDDEDNIIHEIK